MKPPAQNSSQVSRAKQSRLNLRNLMVPVAIYTDESESEVKQNDYYQEQDEEEDYVQENNQNEVSLF